MLLIGAHRHACIGDCFWRCRMFHHMLPQHEHVRYSSRVSGDVVSMMIIIFCGFTRLHQYYSHYHYLCLYVYDFIVIIVVLVSIH